MFCSRLFAAPLRTFVLMACAMASPSLAAAPPPAAPPTSPVRTFDVEAYDVDGSKLLPTSEVEAAVYPFLGPDRTAQDIDGARAALEKAYRDHGYQSVVVELPVQSVADNIVRLHVIEAPVGRLRVTGSRYYSPEAIRREASAFQEGQVPDIAQAQKQMTELNRLPDRRVTPLLRAGVVPGTVDVDLKVSDTLPLHASVELTNDHNQYTTPLRVSASIHYDNLWQLGHSATFTYVVAPENRANSEVFAGSYLAPLINSPVSLLVFGYHSNSNVATIGGANVLGKGYSVGFRAVDQLPRLGDWVESVSAGFDYKDISQNIQVGKTMTPAPVAYWPIDFAYNLQRQGPHYSTKVSLSATAGVRGLGSDTYDFEYVRASARPNFIHVNLDLTQTETLWHGVLASQRVTGQLADGPLVSSEQFAAGGLTSVRGYLQAEAVGDEGLTGNLELISPMLAPRWAGVFEDLRLYMFSDGGGVWVLQPLPDQTKFYALASAGVGLRLELLRHIKGEVALAVPFISGPATHADTPRATFTLRSDF
jgi:hemolysin activation/secretion protein